MPKSSVAGGLLSSAQAAALLGVTQRTVNRIVSRGELPYVDRFGDGPKPAYMFDPAAVLELAAKRARGKQDPQPTLDEVCDERD